jgi:hypothetical protein
VRKTPQRQRDTQTGDCFEACVATILDVELDEVPRYVESNVDMRPYLARLDEWLRPRGLTVVALNRDTCDASDRLPDFVGTDALWIASLRLGSDAVHHAVVMRGSELAWDPEGAVDLSALSDLPERVMTVTVFVPIDPSSARTVDHDVVE